MTHLGSDKRFGVVRKLGDGTYGDVYLCHDTHDNNTSVAVKKLKIKESRKGKGIPQSSIREIGILRAIRHPNVVALKNMDKDDNGIYLIFEMMKTDLCDYLHNLPTYHPLPCGTIRSIMS
jgi:serine/threonine protein kinase